MKRGLFIFLLSLLTVTITAQSDGIEGDSLLYMNYDSTKINKNRTTAYRLTEKLGERFIAPMDTQRLNFSNNVLMEGRGVAVGYLANIGSPAQSRTFSERDEDNDFIFANPYSYYITTPKNALFYDVKDPYTRLSYLPHLFGDKTVSEERFEALFTTNFGKKINIGVDVDYIYTRGHYNHNGTSLIAYRPFLSFLTDRYEAHAYMRIIIT